MKFREALRRVEGEVSTALGKINAAEAERLQEALLKANRIFVVGQGRSGLVMRAFANRLMHIGRTVFVVGESTTPAAGKGDLLVACSKSGETGTTCLIAEKAKRAGAMVAALTARRDSRLARTADIVMGVAEERGSTVSSQFGGSLFEQSCLLILDAICLVLSVRLRQSNERMMSRHTNLE